MICSFGLTQLQLIMPDEENVFTLRASATNTCTSVQFTRLEDDLESGTTCV